MKRQPLPMTVTPPPPSVPRLIVTHSRKVFRSPISRRVGSPRYLRSCGISPRTAWGNTRFAAPRVVRPVTMAWAARTFFGPSLTCGPTTAKGPISQDGSTWAPGSTTAVGWMAMRGSSLRLAVLRVDQHRHELGLGADLAVHDGGPLLLPDRALLLRHLDVQLEAVPGDHRAPEL